MPSHQTNSPIFTIRPIGGGYVWATLPWRKGIVRGLGRTADEAIARLRSLAGLKLTEDELAILRSA